MPALSPEEAEKLRLRALLAQERERLIAQNQLLKEELREGLSTRSRLVAEAPRRMWRAEENPWLAVQPQENPSAVTVVATRRSLPDRPRASRRSLAKSLLGSSMGSAVLLESIAEGSFEEGEEEVEASICHRASSPGSVGGSTRATTEGYGASSMGSVGDEDDEETPSGRPRTTAMIRNVPPFYSRALLLALLDDQGFAGAFDFVYLPMDFISGRGFGYAIVNFSDARLAEQFRARFDGFSAWRVGDLDLPAAVVSWNPSRQGLEALLERYCNSPVASRCVPEAYKPLVALDGSKTLVPLVAPKRQRSDQHRGVKFCMPFRCTSAEASWA